MAFGIELNPIRLCDIKINPVQKEIVNSLLDQGLIGQSYIIEQFEKSMAKWLGVNYCVAVSSGTMADTIALAALKYKYPKKNEVIVPALTFIAQINSVYYNHLKPIFVDVDYRLNMDVSEVEKEINDNTLCLFPVNLLGKPADYDSLSRLNVPIVEDSCESLGSEYNLLGLGFKKCGTIGEMGTFSFFPTHTLATGEGGMIATNDEFYYETAKILRNHGRRTDEFKHEVIGFNGKMSSLEAALGFGAIDTLDGVVETRRRNYKLFGGEEKENEKICPHGFPFLASDAEEREGMREMLKKEGVETRSLFSSIPTQEKAYSFMKRRRRHFNRAEAVGQTGYYIPCHQGMIEYDVLTVKKLIHNYYKGV